ncbi:hypothetical protein D3C77_217000 [compost metagenome]
MRQVAAMRQIHAENRIPGVYSGKINGHIGLCPRMGLHVGMLCPEQFLHSLPGQILYPVHVLTAAVKSFSRVAFRVFIG